MSVEPGSGDVAPRLASGAGPLPPQAPRRRLDGVPFGFVAWLVVLWLFLWGEVSVANVASGIVVAAVLLVVFPLRRSAAPVRPVVRPLAVAHLVVYFFRELVVSTFLVAREIVSPRARIRTGVIAHPIHDPSDGMVTLLANMLALSPGTMMVDVRDDPQTMYVHALLLRDVDTVRGSVARLEAMIIRAFGRDASAADRALAITGARPGAEPRAERERRRP